MGSIRTMVMIMLYFSSVFMHLEPFCFAVWELVYEAITELCLLCFAYFYLVLFISQAKGSNSSSVKNSALKVHIFFIIRRTLMNSAMLMNYTAHCL
ncbi:hypothetical protein HN51_059173 [Arachis hypogaea]